MSGGPPDAWRRLAALTPARIALGRTGASLPTREVLKLALAHAQARDAVHTPFDAAAIVAGLQALGLPAVTVATDAASRDLYLRRPDLGRRLDAASAARLDLDRLEREAGGRADAATADAATSGAAAPTPPADRAPDLAIVVGDGLSATGVLANAVPLVAALLPHLRRLGLALAPVVVATGARVALGDEIGARLSARMALVLIGERPGLSSPDSLGAYLTFAPRPGRSDAERNCVSNIRAGGLSPDAAAARIAWLIEAAFRLGLTGVRLKDQSPTPLAAPGRDTLPPAAG
ncbi:ethanolamine ammonia-lyase small subunit [Amorphus suaedae]